jgi:Zn-dependent metalloprotease
VVYAVDDVARLAYESVAAGRTDQPEQVAVYVDASTGDPITSWSLVPAAEGKGKSLYNGKVSLMTSRPGTRYQLVDHTRGDQSVYDAENQGPNAPLSGTLFKDRDNVWGDFTPEHRQSAAADAAYGSAVTWDYFLAKFDRRGIRNDGVGARSFVHVGRNLDNAFWVEDCFCMAYGDGGTSFHPLVSLDVAAHEMSHGVTNDTAGLIYIGESGALSEATSDIFGTAIEFFADNPEDPGDYLIGEEVTKSTLGFTRRLDKPSLDGISADCWRPDLGADDVHFSSGPANHFFFLLAEGSGSQRVEGVDYSSPTCNDTTVTGIGRTPAAQIWYRALTVHLTSTSGYREARDATIRAARSLYGVDSTECRRVVKSWDAVAVPPGLYGCSGSPPRWGYNALKSGSFEQGRGKGWTATKGVITQNPSFFGPHTGRWYASLSNHGAVHTESVAQTFKVPNTPTAMLRFQLAIFSSDSRSLRHDTFAVTLTDETGRVIALRTLDNTDAQSTYTPHAINLGAYAGETMTLTFTGQEDATAATAFLLDDVLATPK